MSWLLSWFGTPKYLWTSLTYIKYYISIFLLIIIIILIYRAIYYFIEKGDK